MMEPSLKKVNSLFGFVDDCELAASGARFDFGLGSDRDSAIIAGVDEFINNFLGIFNIQLSWCRFTA